MSSVLIIYAITVGLWAYLFTCVLTQSGEVFSFVPKTVLKLLKVSLDTSYSTLPIWKYAIIKITFFCAKCHAGQFALWSFFFTEGGYSLFNHFSFITIAIFTSFITSKYIKEWH